MEVIESILKQTDEDAVTARHAAEAIYKEDKSTVGFMAIVPYMPILKSIDNIRFNLTSIEARLSWIKEEINSDQKD
jgi:hypothetical protein